MELSLPPDVLDAFQNFKPGLLYSGRLSLADMRRLDESFRAALESAPLNAENPPSGVTAVRARLLAAQAQLDVAIASRMRADTMHSALRTLTGDPAKPPSEKLDPLADLADLWRIGFSRRSACSIRKRSAPGTSGSRRAMICPA